MPSSLPPVLNAEQRLDAIKLLRDLNSDSFRARTLRADEYNALPAADIVNAYVAVNAELAIYVKSLLDA